MNESLVTENLGMQWNLKNPTECKTFFQTSSQVENAEKVWIKKPGMSRHGRGITLHRGDDPSIGQMYGECNMSLPDGLIIQAYVTSPAMRSGHTFDMRTYLLIASTKPFLVFYHDGFARCSQRAFSMADLMDRLARITNDDKQSEQNHFFGFQQLEKILIIVC